MIVLEQNGLNGYDADGLNGGLKIAKALKKVSLKNTIKVVKAVAPMALSLIPVAGGVLGGVAGKVLNKVTTNKDGSASLIGRAISGKSGDGTQNLVGRITTSVKAISKTDAGKSVIKLASPLVKNAKASLLEKTGVIPNDAQLETLAEAKGTTPQEELDNIVNNAPDELAKTADPTAPKKDYTLPIIGTVIGAGIAYAIFKK